MQDIIEALKIEDDVLAQIERVCGRQLHRLSVEHDVLQRMLQSMPDEGEESGQHRDKACQDLEMGTCREETNVRVSSTSADKKTAPGDKSPPSPGKVKPIKEKRRNKRTARNPPPSPNKSKRVSRRKQP